MLHFYDGQIRRYLTQVIRLLSNFTVKYSDGTLIQVPVMYGDPDRQVATIMRQNSENVVNSAPRIAVYITALELDRNRLADATYVGKMHIRERDVEDGVYTSTQGRNYTIERLMPTPYKLSLKADIWSSNTDQKLQIMDQILMLFNPSLEIQTTDNYIDWTSLSVVDLNNIIFSNRSIPVGAESNIDIATLELSTPVYISPPSKVKRLGVITNIIMNVSNGFTESGGDYIDGLGTDLNQSGPNIGDILFNVSFGPSQFGILVFNGEAKILDQSEAVTATNSQVEIPLKLGEDINWRKLLDQYPGKYRPDVSTLVLIQDDGNEVRGTIVINPLDEATLSINWDTDTFNTNTLIDSNGYIEGIDPEFNAAIARGTFDAIVDPTRSGPSNLIVGTRYLILDNIGSLDNEDGPDAWKNTDDTDFIAEGNDIIEWDGSKWSIVFSAKASSDYLIYQTNLFASGPGVQYKWNGVSWVKSFEGEYSAGQWRLEL